MKCAKLSRVKSVNESFFAFDSSTTKSEKKRAIGIVDDDDENQNEEERKKPKIEDDATEQITESILDDIHLDEIESRIAVHVIETPEACTHEVAVYPGNVPFPLRRIAYIANHSHSKYQQVNRIRH